MSLESFKITIKNVGEFALDYKLDKSTGESTPDKFTLDPDNNPNQIIKCQPKLDYIIFKVKSGNSCTKKKYVITPVGPAPEVDFEILLKKGEDYPNKFKLKVYSPDDYGPTNVEVGVRELD
jgi:hypothetical protein